MGQVTTTVYIAGGSYNVNNGSSQVYQWTNGVSSPVPGGVTGYDPGENTWSIAASGSNVYMAGDGYDNATQNYTAMSSNNGTITDLTDGTVNASANAVAVSGSDVYVAGTKYDSATGNYIAMYWKNGTITDLTDGTVNASASVTSVVRTA